MCIENVIFGNSGVQRFIDAMHREIERSDMIATGQEGEKKI